MNHRILLSATALLATLALPAHAEGIDLQCEALATRMIERLGAEGLLTGGSGESGRARAITVELCSTAQAAAREQHEESRREMLTNWLTQPTGGKEGNERLKRLKR